jgi:RNA polymerase sigma-70 factor (ECF subfamily)
MCADSELAKDIFHEAFIKAIGKLTQLRVDEQFGGWLKRIVINECLKQMKQSKLFVDFKESSLEVPDEGTEWFAEINIQHVNEEVQKLPEGCRQVFVMYAMEDYSHKEVAEALHISESTSKSQYQRARVLLKERLLKRS